MTARTFVDTNVLVYAEDLDAGPRHDKARLVVEGLWETGLGVVSVQVLQEFFSIVTRKLPRTIPPYRARAIIAQYLHWETVENSGALLLSAIDVQVRHRLSFWDAMVVQAAVQSGAAVLLSEDFGNGRVIEGVRIENPFATGSERG
jgi:predicted nucleic acid-binding protein